MSKNKKPRNKKHKPIETSVPMMVNREIHKTVETLQENLMITAFQFGAATKKHYDYLVRIGNMMNIANQLKPTPAAEQLRDLGVALSKDILERYNKTGKFGVSSAQLLAMREFVKHYDIYWKAESTTLYNRCVFELNAFYQEIEDKRKCA